MGAFSPKDERRLMLGCLAVAAGFLVVNAAIVFALYKLVVWASN